MIFFKSHSLFEARVGSTVVQFILTVQQDYLSRVMPIKHPSPVLIDVAFYFLQATPDDKKKLLCFRLTFQMFCP